MRKIQLLIGCCVTMSMALTAAAQEWGDMTVTFKYDGTAPSQTPLNITKDQAYCGPFNVVDETLVVNKENGGIQNVVVYLNPGRNQKVAIHPAYEPLKQKTVVVDNNECRFDPHIQVMWTERPLVVKNSDTIGHNTNFTTLTNPQQNVLIPAGGELKLNFSKAERLPASQVACNIHPWMTGWLVIKDHPYMGISDENGKVTIKNIPAGEWSFQFWHEKSGYVDEAKLGNKTLKWRRGRPDFDIKAGENDLGEFKLAPALFEK